MKIRNGFVSNSSSSSFIVEQYDKYNRKTGEWETPTAKDIKKDIVDMLTRWRNNNIKNSRKYYKKHYPEISEKELLQMIEEHKTRISNIYTDTAIKKCIKVTDRGKLSPEEYDTMTYWYPRSVIDTADYIVEDTKDNFIPETLAKKIIKKYKVNDYLLHMG